MNRTMQRENTEEAILDLVHPDFWQLKCKQYSRSFIRRVLSRVKQLFIH
jgi:hypothetical protein